jgi:hypothetical protein
MSQYIVTNCDSRTGKQVDLTRLRNQLGKAVDVVSFTPTEVQRRAKSNFWSFFASGEALPPTQVDLAIATKYAGDKRITEWWQLEGFPEWFANRDEFRQRVEFLADLALDELYHLIRDPETQATAKVAAIRMIMDVGKKLSQKSPNEDDSVAGKIAEMNQKQLEEYIKSRLTKLSLTDNEDQPQPN